MFSEFFKFSYITVCIQCNCPKRLRFSSSIYLSVLDIASGSIDLTSTKDSYTLLHLIKRKISRL